MHPEKPVGSMATGLHQADRSYHEPSSEVRPAQRAKPVSYPDKRAPATNTVGSAPLRKSSSSRYARCPTLEFSCQFGWDPREKGPFCRKTRIKLRWNERGSQNGRIHKMSAIDNPYQNRVYLSSKSN
jgi:hypothetical protein